MLVVQSTVVDGNIVLDRYEGYKNYSDLQTAINAAKNNDFSIGEIIVNATSFEYILAHSNNLTFPYNKEIGIIVDLGGSSGTIFALKAYKGHIQGFAIPDRKSIRYSFPQAAGFTQELLRENYNVSLVALDIEKNKAWIRLSNNGMVIDNKIISVGDTYNYDWIINFTLDEIFYGTSNKFLRIRNIYQYSKNSQSFIVQNESAYLMQGSTGKFIFAGGGIDWELKENYALKVIDIDTRLGIDHDRKAMLLLTKDKVPVDNAILNVDEKFEYYNNGNLILSADLAAVYCDRKEISLAMVSKVCQYEENNITNQLLHNATHIYSIGKPTQLNSPLIEEFYVAVGEMQDSSQVTQFNLTSINSPGLLLYDPEAGSKSELINFSINNNSNIPASSFIYSTSMYASDNGMPVIAWLGEPYYVINHNNTSMNITRLLVDEGEDDTHLISDKENLALSEGFAIFVSDIFIDDGDNVEIILTQYGEEKDKQILNYSEWYEYRSNMKMTGHTDNLILRFNVESLFYGMANDLVKINSLKLISCDVLRINNEDILRFSLKDSRISWHEQPYYVIDDNTTNLTIARLLVDDGAYDVHYLRKGETCILPEGFAITILDIDPYVPLDRYNKSEFGYGQFLFLLTQYGIEVEKKLIRAIDSYEYTIDLNGSGQTDNWVLKFNVGGIYSDWQEDWIEINSIRLISQDVINIENGDEVNVILDGYKTNIENNGTTVTVVRDKPNENINLTEDGINILMGNWFNVRVDNASDAAIVSSIVTISDTYELVGAVEYPDSGYGEFNLTSKKNPAILYYDLENAAGYETLNFSIDYYSKTLNIVDSYKIPAASFVYTTAIYPASNYNDRKIAWLGEPYCVIENDKSSILISKILIDEHSDDYYLLSMDNALKLPDGFNLIITRIDNLSNTVWFSLIKDGVEVDNGTAGAGDIYQYKADLSNNGINDNRVLRFNVEYIDKNNSTALINSLRMISPELLMIIDQDTHMLEDYGINIDNTGNMIEIRINDTQNDIILTEDKLTGILNDTFFIKVNGAAEVVKILNATDIRRDKPVIIKRSADLIKQKTPDIRTKGEKHNIPGYDLFMCVYIMLIAMQILRKKK